MKRRLSFAAPVVMIVAACGGKVSPRPAVATGPESAESKACRSIEIGSSCSQSDKPCTFDAAPCTPDARMCVDGAWVESTSMSCNPPPP